MHAGSRPDYIRCYRVLGLKPGCSLEQARRHYKLLSQRCHPDRYHNDPEARRLAEKRQRAVNLAMRTIADYHKAHGCMPLRARPRLQHPDPAERWDRSGKEQPAVQLNGGGSGIWMSLLMALMLVATIWLLWRGTTTPPGTEQQLAISGGGYLERGMVRSRLQPDKFGFGDPPEIVRLIQGEPSQMRGDAWYYGKSVVYFRDGRVVGWLNHADFPLSASSESSRAREEYIRIGSTPEEVSRIQGEPLFKNATRWDYGPSYIEFRHDRVAGWHSSPLRPLRVRE